MTADDVCAFLELMRTHGVEVWLDGGWAVDACLGAQTRRHDDVDIVIDQRDVPAAVSALRARGYVPVPRPDTRDWNFVMGDDLGHQVDFHVVVFDDQGRGIYGPLENAQCYPAEASPEPGRSTTVQCAAPRPSGWSAPTPATSWTRPTGPTSRRCASVSGSRSRASNSRFRTR
jgi:lincosamide nucleotidyltransferase A/C/D/E